jgi:hypothetical protein
LGLGLEDFYGVMKIGTIKNPEKIAENGYARPFHHLFLIKFIGRSALWVSPFK